MMVRKKKVWKILSLKTDRGSSSLLYMQHFFFVFSLSQMNDGNDQLYNVFLVLTLPLLTKTVKLVRISCAYTSYSEIVKHLERELQVFTVSGRHGNLFFLWKRALVQWE